MDGVTRLLDLCAHLNLARIRHFMSAFDDALRHVLGIEGDFSDHPADRGGATRFGITEALARRYGYTGPMHQLPIEKARYIYLSDFWQPLRLDLVADVSAAVALEVFDAAVNTGRGTAAKWLQRSLNVLNREGRDYADLVVDGMIGPASLGALRSYAARRGSEGITVLLRALNCLQGAHYITLSEKNPSQEAFTYGWLRQRVQI